MADRGGTEVRLPGLPDCWETCGACQGGEVRISEIRVAPGDRVERDQPLLVIETDKTEIDIPCAAAGTVVEVAVAVGDCITEGMLLVRLAAE